jgi:DNA-binding NarL/FixJ family response regulator
MRSHPSRLQSAPPPPASQHPPLPLDRSTFDQRARAQLTRILDDLSSQSLEPSAFVDLAWDYFVAGFSAGTQSVSAAPAQESAESRDPLADMVAALTSRRLEVLRLVARGLTNREIAEILDISSHTVKSHMAGLFVSLDVTNRTEAAYALQCYEEIYFEEPPSRSD